MRSVLIRVALILAVAAIAVEGYYVYQFYTDNYGKRAASTITSETTVPETTRAREAKPDEERPTTQAAQEAEGGLPDYRLDRIEQIEDAGNYSNGVAIVHLDADPAQLVFLQDVTDEILTDNPSYDILEANFYSGPEETPKQWLGTRMAFAGPDAEEAYYANGGEGVEGALRRMCERWTAEEESPPPTEWDCNTV